MTNLLPCPFCGSSAVLGHNTLANGMLRMKIQCQGHGCWATIEEWIGDESSVESVIKSWNTRHEVIETEY